MLPLHFTTTYLLLSVFHSIYQEALIKSILVKTKYEADPKDYPTYKTMAANRRLKKNKIPFLSVPYHVGSTTSHNPALNSQQAQSFGCPRYFFRFNCTSAIASVPYAYVHWSMFTATKFHRTCFMGHIFEQEWETGPRCRPEICSFVTLDDITPSRFVVAYDNMLDVAFVALDPERIGETTDDGMITDFGDNKTRYKTKSDVYDDASDDDSDDSNDSTVTGDSDDDNDNDDDACNSDSGTDIMSDAMLRFLKMK
jgi:hypothetical protein